jgi:uncharacterized delta-60 repeat protein
MAQTTLSAGDIAVIGLNSDGDDEFSFLLLKDITAGTSIYITDKGWNDATGFYSGIGDGIWQWSTADALSAGTIVHIKTTNNGVIEAGSLAATPGTVAWVENNGTVISYSGDQIFLYQGTEASPTIIAACHWNVESYSTSANWDGACAAAQTSALPDQLTNGVNAIWLYGSGPTEYDNFRYNCSVTSGTPSVLRAAINNISNWDVDSTNSTAFTLNPFPCTFAVDIVTPPTVTNLGGDSVTCTEDGGAVLLDSGSDASATKDAGATWDGGILTASFESGQEFVADLLGVLHTGTGAGQIGLNGSYVTYGGTIIGTVGGGSGVLPLTVTFNASATDAAVAALLQSLTFLTTDHSDPSTTSRTVRIVLIDSAGTASSNNDVTVSVTAVNDAPTFNAASGTVTTVDATIFDVANVAAVQPDGKILVAGLRAELDYSEGYLLLMRYNADGSLDTGFGTGGIAEADVWSSDSYYETGVGIAVLPDGKIVVGVGSNSTSHDGQPGFGAARFNADGSLDTGFGTSGTEVFEASGATANSYTAHGMALDDAGNLLLVGESFIGSEQRVTVMRITPDGTLDAGFGTDGVVTTQVSTGYNLGNGILVQPDGKIVVAGSAYTVATSKWSAIALRYTTAGVLDTTFGTDGVVTVTVAVGAGHCYGKAVALQADGKIVLAGAAADTTSDFMALRLTSAGVLDTTFNSSGSRPGTQTVDLDGDDDYLRSLALQSDGSILLGGQCPYIPGIIRLTSTGAVDTAFDGDGIRLFPGNTTGAQVTLQGDGRILSTGYDDTTVFDDSDVFLNRLNADGTTDASFGTATDTLDGTPTYTQGDPAVVLDGDVSIFDTELWGGSFAGATLTLARNGGASANDLFSNSGTLSELTGGGDVTVDGTVIGTVTTNSGGTLLLTFTATATEALVDSAMRQIAYSNSIGSPASVQIDWSFSDGNSGSQGSGGAESVSGSTTVSVTSVTSLSIDDVSSNEGDSGSTTFSFTVSLSESAGPGGVTFDIATADGTATDADSDYITKSLTSQTIPEGSSSYTFDVTVTGDTAFEMSETFAVNITNVTGAAVSDGQGTGTITNDDSQPTVTLGVSGSPLAENGGAATITATLSNRSYQNVTVNMGYTGTATGGGTDYSADASITINAGSTTGTATATAVQDILVEGQETIIVDITGVTNGTEDGTQQETITLLDDDLPKVTLSQSVASFAEASGTNTITATLDVTFSEDATITIGANASSTATGTYDYTLSSTTITILAGNLTGTATLTAVQDSLDEADETVVIDILSAENAIEDGVQQVTATITDDDNSSLSDGDTVPEGGTGINDGGTIEDITVEAGGSVTNNGTINNLTNAGTVTGGTVGGDSANSGTLDDVTIAEAGVVDNQSGTIVDSENDGTVFGGTLEGDIDNNGLISGTAPDGSIDPDYAVTIAEGAVVTGGTLSGSIVNEGELVDVTITEGSSIVVAPGGTFSGTITLTDDSGVVAVIDIPAGVSFPEDGEEVIFTFSELVGLGGLPILPDGYVLVDGLLISETGAMSGAPVTITIPCREDNLPDDYDDSDLAVLVYDPTAGAWKRIAFEREDDAHLSITTDILCAYAVALRPDDESEATVLLGNLSGQTNESGGTASFILVLSREPTDDVVVTLSVSDATEAMISPTEVTFTPENYMTPQSITMTGVDDGRVDGDVSYTIVLSPVVSEDPDYNGIDPTDLSVVNADNEIPVLLSPSDDEIDVSLTPELVIATFPTTDPDFTHAVTRWQISIDPAFSDEDMVLDLSTGMERFPVPTLVLEQGTSYYWRVKVYTAGGEASSWSGTGVFSTIVSDSGDLDGNGIPDDQAVPDATDLDGNGTVDNDQADIMSFTSAVGDIRIGVKSWTDAELLFVTAIDPATITDTVNRPDNLEAGLLGFKVAVAPGATVEVTIYLSLALSDEAGWYKYDPVEGWVNFTEYATVSTDRKSVVLRLTDGGIGDLDGVANGIIVDPSGPDTGTGSGTSSHGGGGGCGCFITTVAASESGTAGWCFGLAILGMIVAGSVTGRIARMRP